MYRKISLVIMVLLLFIMTCFAAGQYVKIDEMEKSIQLKESIIQTMLSPPDVLPIESVGAIEIKRLPAGLVRKNK